MSLEIAGYMLFFLWSAYWLALALSMAATEWAKTVAEARRGGHTVPPATSALVLAVTAAVSVVLCAIPWGVVPGAYWLAVWAAS